MPHVRDIIGALFEPVQRGSDQMLISSLIGSAMRTLVTAAAGLAIAFAVGFGLALLLLRFTPLRQGLTPWIVASQTVPLVAIAPMIVIWVGKANLPPWFAVASISAYLAFFPITVNTLRGLRSAAPAEVELMRSYAAGETSTLLYLRIPTALPLMFTGLRLAATAAVVGAIVGELSAGTVRGIGNDLLDVQLLLRQRAGEAVLRRARRRPRRHLLRPTDRPRRPLRPAQPGEEVT